MMDERTVALEQVNRALPIFEQINELYLTANSLNQRGMMLQTDVDRGVGKRRSIFRMIGGLLGLYVGGLLHLFVSVLFDGVLLLLSLFLIVVGVLFGIRLGDKLNTNLGKNAQAGIGDQLASIQAQIDQISKKIYQITVDNQMYIDPIPRDYRYYDAVVFFEKALANGRADSMKEAINLYEDYLHKQALEAQGRMMLEQSRQQSAMMANIERTSRETAINTGITAAFTVANFFARD